MQRERRLPASSRLRHGQTPVLNPGRADPGPAVHVGGERGLACRVVALDDQIDFVAGGRDSRAAIARVPLEGMPVSIGAVVIGAS